MRNSAPATRARILEAADDLFYREGLRAVSMDRIARDAGITKKTLYYHFRSKDDLMGAYLEARHGPAMERFQNWAGATGTVGERMDRMLRNLGGSSNNKGWRGCGFLRAACELAELPGHPASVAARNHKLAFEAWLRSLLEGENRADAADLARMLMIVLDGAIAEILVHRDAAYAEAAGRAARLLLDGPCEIRAAA